MRVEVLLATYNSEAYLEQLLSSLVSQTYRDFVLVVSDDCSTDRTLDLLGRWSGRFANAPEILVRDAPSGSAAANFASMLASSQGDYVFLADHDDVWMPEKIEAGLARIRALEERFGPRLPVLVHGDLAVIDAEARPIAPSFWAFKSIQPEFGTSLRTALMHPSVTGCTAVLNRSLVALVREIPPSAVMHDWWINLVAAAFGVVDFDPQPHIHYRIHGANTSAPEQSSFASAVKRLPSVAEVRRWVRIRLDQGAAFLDRYGDELPLQSRRALEEFASIRDAGPLARRRALLAGGFRSPDPWRNAALLAFV